MPFLRRWPLILILLGLGGGLSFADGNNTKEERAYAVAVGSFQDGIWSRAEVAFTQFVAQYPGSAHVTDAVLLLAQAEFKEGKYAEAIARLKAGEVAAGNEADQYVYWIGAAQFQSRDYTAAAETFLSLPEKFPRSPSRLWAVVQAAAAFTELGRWSQVTSLLQGPDEVFQNALKTSDHNEPLTRGELLLAQALFAQNNFAGASAVLDSMDSWPLAPDLDWQRVYLLCQSRRAGGELDAALTASTNLLRIARPENDGGLRMSESVALHAGLLEQTGHAAEAQAAYRENLTTNAPVSRQREAALKIAEIAIGLNQFSNAVPALENFFTQFPDAPAADTALLTLGELRLKDYLAQPEATNQLVLAQARFDQFIGTFTNSPLLGKAYLDRGWCFWIAQKIPESLADFEAAANRLPVSEDRAVARFKAGDARFLLNDFLTARADYESVLDDFNSLPGVRQALGEQVLYQSLRANLALNDSPAANATLARILKSYPEGDLSDNAILLVAETVDNSRRPAVARALLQQFEKQFPHSELLPQARLAVARTYEQDQNWPAAITNYQVWLRDFPTNALLPQASYSLAAANFQMGDETNAFVLFTNFVAQFPTNALAPLAQWWVADHFFRAGDFPNAERNYKYIFQNANWQGPPSENRTNLFYPAQMMAGRAAVARTDYAGAIRDYFSKLEADTNCPIQLRVQATFADGSAQMLSVSTDTNQPLANFERATNLFAQICQLYPTNEMGALAWGEIGDCALQLSAYDQATNAYAQVFNSPAAGISARSQAQIGFGIALEKKAALVTGADQTALLKLALDNYLDVFDTVFGNNLRLNELADPFWVKKAGLQALPLVESFGTDSPERFIDKMEELLPQLKDLLESKRAGLTAEKK